MYKSRRILAPGEISEFNGSPMLQLIVQPASVENRMYQAGSEIYIKCLE